MSLKIAQNCPRCGVVPTENNRLITDSCGHCKCRRCFLKEEESCLECQEHLSEPSEHAVASNDASIISQNETQVELRLKHKTIKKTDGGIATLAKHIEQIQTSTGLEYQCTICCKQFRSRSQRYYHLGCGNDSFKKYKCNLCEKSFASRSHMNYHLESHTTQIYHCSQCSKTFSNQMVLKRHQQVHDNTKTTFNCVECNKVFRRKDGLLAHIAQQHRNELPFSCNHCEKSYALKSRLKQHTLTHLSKTHECSYCGKRFQRNSTLKLHLKRHSKTEQFVCTTCMRNFSDAGALLRHAKLHKDTVKYKCTHCTITTVRKDNMLRHVRSMHCDDDFKNCVEIIKPTDIAAQQSESQSLQTTTEVGTTHFKSYSNSNLNLPQTVENSSVIKCIGNVEPVKIPNAPNTPFVNEEVIGVAETSTLTALENVSLNKTESPKTCPTLIESQNNKKYNPIEMYRKILISDDEEETFCENNQEVATAVVNDNTKNVQLHQAIPPIEQQQQQRATVNTSNFSETHWRKNFKYTYEYEYQEY